MTKRITRSILCGGVLAALMCVPSLAAEQGDFALVVNGEDVSFTDAAPQLKDGRSYLPMVATFQALGYSQDQMTWDAATQTVTAQKDGAGISLTIGQKTITLTNSLGAATEARTIETDAAPYIDAATSRTYIPIGLAADALGYTVGWDSQTKTVIIDDVDAIWAANTATYSVMDRYMEYQRAFTQKNYQVKGSYDLALGMDLEDSQIDASAKGQYTMLQSGATAVEYNTDMALTAKVDGQDALAEENFPATVDAQLRGDLDTGVFYFKSDALTKLAGLSAENLWYKLDLGALMDSMAPATGMGYQDLLSLVQTSQEGTYAQVLEATLREYKPTSAEMTTADLLAYCNALSADSSFTRSGSNYVSTTELDGMKLTMTLYASGSKITGYAVEMSGGDDALGVTMTMDTSMKGSAMDMNMAVKAEGLELTMTMDGTYTSTTAKPQTAPPTGATVMDLMEALTAA